MRVIARLLFASLTLVFLWSESRGGAAATFSVSRQDGGRPLITLAGTIGQGDADRLRALLARAEGKEKLRYNATVALNSPGGSFLEGMALGQLFRENMLKTVVRSSDACLSACALAFLGGSETLPNGFTIRRILEPGGRLAFHAVSSGDDETLVRVNEGLALQRSADAKAFDYVISLGGVDAEIFAALMRKADLAEIDTPRLVRGLGIELHGLAEDSTLLDYMSPPQAWARNACKTAVSRMLSPTDALGGVENRVEKTDRPLADLSAFAAAISDDLREPYPADDARGRLLASLAPADFVSFVAGEVFYPTAAMRFVRLGLKRGGGYYYDACYVAADADGIAILILDTQLAGRRVYLDTVLSAFDPDARLW
ncbi:hypothetical protein [Aurantimonas sp. VKM B-3413]|uniref:COG3904 family protein n=1 Tax=Aurantimonas sp. VKM B-3413 TaxID=2779401 RepID=UPI001E4F7F57|nr:hypothetical protein [Aurantimonas sp. VKM B-3413]MCB8840244.1 hypothetical protein [Aurantimonas sp. VKM B-3413]